jgi:hypothetical protein
VAAAQQLGDAPGMFHGGIIFQNLILLIHLIAVTMDEDRPGGGFERADRFFQKCRFPQIVLIEKGQVRALSQLGTGITRHGLPSVPVVPHVPNDGSHLHQGASAVSRRIVHDDDFIVGIGLLEHGLDGWLQIPRCTVVCGNDDADVAHDQEGSFERPIGNIAKGLRQPDWCSSVEMIGFLIGRP